VNDREILALFDREMREHPPPPPGSRIERAGPVVRLLGPYCSLLYSQLNEENARTVIAQESEFFRSLGKEVEWKVYDHDLPPNLGALLREAGYVADPPETLLVFDLVQPLPPGARPGPVEVRRVTDERTFRDAVRASQDAFGRGKGWHEEEYRKRLDDPTLALFVAYQGGEPIASARLELPPGGSFAGLWGGGTSPRFRGRGVYRLLVETRAELARRRGYRFLTVEALETSRPILARWGFRRLDTVTGWVRSP
jgi:GNAT superfamily N-acetyltransferase